MTYQEALSFISSIENRGWRLGLDRMEEFVRRAGLEEAISGKAPKFIHVAGTNGKGSVTAYLQYILREAGYRVGGFFSPFVYDIRERIQLDCEMISEEDFARHVERLKPIADSLDGTEFGSITEFEFKTAMGFAFWEEKGCDWVALEVGLGGRLDATNVVISDCTVITSIGLDHVEFLGDTLEKIALEKAGIFKPGVPAVVGELDPESLSAVVEHASEVGSSLWRFGQEFGIEPRDYDSEGFSARFPGKRFDDLRNPIPGVHQPYNIALAVAALLQAGIYLDEQVVRAGFRKVRLPGRMECRQIGGKAIWLDGAHNADSMGGLMSTLLSHRIKCPVAVFGMLKGHAPEAVCWLLENFVDEIHLCPIDFRRTADPEELKRHFGRTTRVVVHQNSESAIKAALKSRPGKTILVTGSFYLVGEVGRYLDSVLATRAQ